MSAVPGALLWAQPHLTNTVGQFLAAIGSRELCDARADPANAQRPQRRGTGTAPQQLHGDQPAQLGPRRLLHPRDPRDTGQATEQPQEGARAHSTWQQTKFADPSRTQLLGSQFPSDWESCSIPACPGQVRHASTILCTLAVMVLRDRDLSLPDQQVLATLVTGPAPPWKARQEFSANQKQATRQGGSAHPDTTFRVKDPT